MRPVIEIDIVKVTSGIYEVYCLDRPDSPTTHHSISEAIREYGDVPSNYAHFVEVRYGGVSLGTQSAARMAKEPSVMADELVALAFAVQCSAESID